MTTLDLAAPVLQPGSGAIDADHYLPTRVDQLFWGGCRAPRTPPC